MILQHWIKHDSCVKSLGHTLFSQITIVYVYCDYSVYDIAYLHCGSYSVSKEIQYLICTTFPQNNIDEIQTDALIVYHALRDVLRKYKIVDVFVHLVMQLDLYCISQSIKQLATSHDSQIRHIWLTVRSGVGWLPRKVLRLLTHWGLVTHMCVSEVGLYLVHKLLDARSPLRQCLNQCYTYY